ETMGNERRIVGSNQSGLSNVRALIRRAKLLDPLLKTELSGSPAQQKKILDVIKSLESQGYSFDHADASLELVMLEALGKLDRILRIVEAEVHSNLTPLVADPIARKKDSKPKTKAIVKIGINGDDTVFLEVAEDIGPIGALTETVLQAMARKFEGRAPRITLEDYRVEKVPQSEEGEHAPVLVTVEWRNGEEVFTTTGVSENSIEAGWECVVDAFEYALQRNRLASSSQSQS
ncbi:MAG: alpha-isopropylmalate synthase regulatory domain-containing protein, partial [Candidatus Peribacteraceae bacterium]|nr:alpha-isopropylmalate synthase regulatory domain-containing protein [Candidatus Peribacteraceae bacterium]